MGLTSGTKLASYEIISPLGAGGMGEVYRARDTKLDRDVALKILPVSFASDGDRSMRFQREARTVAALNHPNIVTIFSVEHAEGIHFLTMELYNQRVSAEDHLLTRIALERAVKPQPGNADAWAGLAMVFLDEDRHLFNPRPNALDRHRHGVVSLGRVLGQMLFS